MPLFLGTLGGISPDRCYTRDFLRFYRRRATFSILFNILSVTNDEEKAGFAGLSLPSSTHRELFANSQPHRFHRHRRRRRRRSLVDDL